MKKELFTKPTHYLILTFVVGVLLMLGFCEAHAEWGVEYTHDSNAGTTAFNQGLDQIGARYTFKTGTSVYLSPLLAIGGNIERDSFHMGIADQFGKYEIQIQLNRVASVMDGGLTARRLIGDGPFQLSLGGTYWINESPGSDSTFTFNLGMRYTF